jgi:hypothetical protein
MFLVAKIHSCFRTSVSNQGRKFVEVCHMFKSSLGINWCVPYRSPNLPEISEIVFCCSFIILQPLAMFSCKHHLEGQHECLHCSTELLPCLSQKNSSNVCSPHGIVPESCFEHLLHLQSSILKQNLTQIFSAI